MSKSKQEEIISALWIIAAINCFGFGFETAGWILICKGLLDLCCCIFLALREVRKKLKAGEDPY